MNSLHYSLERTTRDDLIKNVIGYGKVIKRVNVESGHPKGPEVHEISDTGIITIYNAWTGKLVTRLIARPGQLERYYKNIPEDLLKKSIYNCRKGYNRV